jgi:hypothetical protein
VFRLLRVLASRGVFEQLDDERFALNLLAEPLRRDAPGGSARAYARYVGAPFLQRPWENLVSVLRTGQPSFPAFHGVPIFEYLASDAETSALFNDAMSNHTSRDAGAVVASYDFTGGQTVVDVGGGHGALLAAILAASTDARGVLLERSHVLSGARGFLGAAGLTDRCRLVEGDMLESVPAAADIYVLKRVIHDWNDEEAGVILETANGRWVLRAGCS